MSGPLFQRSPIQQALDHLRADLIHADGPQISTMRNHRFAIVPYDPAKEFELRAEVQKLATQLVEHGWVVLSISLQALLLDRIRKLDAEHIAWIMQTERELAAYDLERGMNSLKEELAQLIEGPQGLAADCARIIAEHAEAHPDKADRTVVLIGRAGALYPFFRSSALLRHLDGRTGHTPVVLLYPGERRGPTGLSFMGELDPDNDYRPRIY
ncbi:MAG: DUF1788 domain-containing protein [Deltaproteobacteria bacterium]|nr:MAG: DUF1788 domain-containing protein [Deltaproteobacteria bacterium]